MVASLRRRGEAQASLDELHAQIDDLKAEAENHAAATAAARAQLAEEQAQLAAVQAQIVAAAVELALPQAQITQAIQIQALVYAGFSQKRAGEAAGVSENTVRKRLELAGELLNGSGLYRRPDGKADGLDCVGPGAYSGHGRGHRLGGPTVRGGDCPGAGAGFD
jgi:ABC-type transporter Mla subunit MlaD